MMKQITPSLIVGDNDACSVRISDRLAMIHACKEPCHRRAVNYTGNLVERDPHYLAKECWPHLYLNLIDPDLPLFRVESFRLALAFAERAAIDGRILVVHCNQGRSRAPAIMLLILAKQGAIPSSSYDEAVSVFVDRLYSRYLPGKGIECFLRREWERI
jgi:hypothetical protein